MSKSATDVMQEILVAAVLDGIGALRAASRGVPNTLLRDVNAIHANTTFADLPPELQNALQTSVRAAFTRLLKEGYSVSPAGSAPPRPSSPPRRDQRPAGPGGHRGPRPGGGQPPRGPRTGPGGPRPGGGRGPRPKK